VLTFRSMYRDRKKAHFFYVLIDIFFIGLTFYFSYLVRYHLDFLPINVAGIRSYYLIFILWGASIIFFLHNLQLYSTDRSLTIPRECYLVFRAVFLSAILLALIIFALKIDFFSRIIFILVSCSLFVTLSFWRMVKRIYLRYKIVHGQYNFNVLIIGAGKSGKELAEEIKDNPYLGLRIVGFLDDHKTDPVNGHQILGKISDMEKVIQDKFVDEVYITIPSQRLVVSKVLNKAIRMGRSIRILADNFEIPMYRVKINHIGLLPLLSYHESKMHGTDSIIKRFLDVSLATTLFVILLPIFLIISLLIKVDSPGSVFYISKRSGRKGRVFNFYKFRSMRKDAEKHKESLRHISEVTGPIFKIRNDPRMTRLGRVLRKYSLDELPQLINVIKGDMSLVGPRPLPADESSKCERWQLRRLEVRPGLACLAQIRGRSDISFYKWMKWDLWYVDNWTLSLDLQILFWMIPAVLKRKGAY